MSQPIPEEMLFEELKREVDVLGRALGDAVLALSGQKMLDLEEEFRITTKSLRGTYSEDLHNQLQQTVKNLSFEEAEGMVRAFATYFHLVNLAEERQRVRVNRERERSSSTEKPRNESFLALVGEFKKLGMTLEQVVAVLTNLELHLTFTAHPTETRRRTQRYHISEIERLLEIGNQEEALGARVALMWGTSELRVVRPTVEDEVKGGLFYTLGTLWKVIPRLVDGLERAVEAHFGSRPELVPPILFRSWIGGDRDGNPNVLPDVTGWAQDYAKDQVVHKYVDDVDVMIRDLSLADERVNITKSLKLAIEDNFQRLTLPPRFDGEPYRQFAMGLRFRLRSLVGEQPGPGFFSSEEFVSDLKKIENSLEESGLGLVSRVVVKPMRLRGQTYGLDLVELDLREESKALTEACAELLRAAGVMDNYASLSPDDREKALTAELKTARPLSPVGYRPQTKTLQVALDSLRNWKSRGAHVVSMTHYASDLLEVILLAREVGLYRPGKALPFDIAPLFETLGDLENAPEVVTKLLTNPVFRAHVNGRGGLEIMIGYSDSNKDAGFLAANWALYTAQEAISAAAHAEKVEVYFFHGRGTSTARGGGSAGRAIASLPPGTVGHRMRLTEQGEALADRYSQPDLAYRNLEQLLFHFALASARDSLGIASNVKPEWRDALDKASKRSTEAYRELLLRPGFFEFYEQITPIREIGALNIASRPVYRSGRVREIKDLRAIPWVMSWTQVRLLLPGWYGIAEGLVEIPADLRKEMFRDWPFFASTLESAASALSKADINIAREYLRLVDPKLADVFFSTIEASFKKAVEILEETFGKALMADNPVLRRQTDLRNPYVDPISYVQVELLDRYRKSPEEAKNRPDLERALMLSLLGIAAGLRNAG